MLKIKKIVILVFFLVASFGGNAQQEKVAAAINFLQKENLDSAKIYIDQAVLHPTTSLDFEAWHVKGFVYKAIYRDREKADKQSLSRLLAVEAFKKSIELDSEKKVLPENVKGIKYLISTLYNDAGSCLDSVNYKVAVINFERFRQYFSFIDPSPENLKQKEIEFNLAIASVYDQIYRSKKEKDIQFFNLTKSALNTVLSIDPNNVNANYRMGILYYNQAVDLINDSDSGIDLVALNEIQDNSIVLFKQSLPFMEKAYELNPNHKETLMGLSGIYFGLNEKEKSDAFKEKYEKIPK